MQVILTEPIHPVPLARLREAAEVVAWDDPRSADWSHADAIIVRAAPVTRARISSARRLKVIGKHGIGVNAIDVQAAREHGVQVVYTPTANVNSVAELIVGFMLALMRKLPDNMRMLRAGAARISPTELTGTELGGKTLGLVGLGRISQRVAEICRFGFGMEVVGYDPFLPADRFAELGIVHHATLDALLAASDVVSVSVPYTPQTRHLIGEAQLRLCRPGALLINTARGGVVDEIALADALRRGLLAGAACDVFETEPPPPQHPLLALPNFLGSLHVGASTNEALLRVGNTVVSDVLAVLRGEKPEFPYLS
ncbi:Hydroxyacid dehydrogenase [Rhodovastum atsumiense]|uniref:hydroxyacid dehydrogenase n=1 Tax=Rhodovastum atsumiense TaxID=504468 RepID=UPI00193C525C|nr:hydroxyacid dehydrogenase [Rhodovastum atsumiense]CAH2601432.1 Hydroxyacid dehydrogenase [Rhodovastum atsumiense]